LSSILELLAGLGHNIDDIWTSICDLVIKTLCTVQPSLAHIYKSCQPDDISNAMCFEILGLDIILDETLKPWLLEVNHSPSFSTDSPLDHTIKLQVIKEALEILGLKPTDRRRYENQRKQ